MFLDGFGCLLIITSVASLLRALNHFACSVRLGATMTETAIGATEIAMMTGTGTVTVTTTGTEIAGIGTATRRLGVAPLGKIFLLCGS